MSGTNEIRVVNETTGGEKGQKDERFDLIPAEPMRLVALHYGIGARKYADRNWEKGYDWSLSLGALERHLNAFKRGEDIDEETQSPHLAAVIFHALALLEFGATHPELDDRVKRAAESAFDEVRAFGSDEPIRTDPGPHLKVGDRVRIADDARTPSGIQHDVRGAVGVIDDLMKHTTGVWAGYAAVEVGDIFYAVHPDDLTLEPSPVGPHLKIGDRVRVGSDPRRSDGTTGFIEKWQGQVVTVVQTADGGGDVRVSLGVGRRACVDPKFLTLVD